jgi:hypothetical protein
MDLKTNYLPLDILENDFGDVNEAMFQRVGRPHEHIFCILRIEKRDLDEFG